LSLFTHVSLFFLPPLLQSLLHLSYTSRDQLLTVEFFELDAVKFGQLLVLNPSSCDFWNQGLGFKVAVFGA
jgi:hypothetical protein